MNRIAKVYKNTSCSWIVTGDDRYRLSKWLWDPRLIRFQEHFHEYKIVVSDGLHCDSILFECQVESPKRINFLFDDVNRNYHVITNLTGAMAKRYVCRACNKGCRHGIRHICNQTCSDCIM